MTVEAVDVVATEGFADDAERIDAVVRFVADPERDAVIADLGLVADRPVRFEADLVLLRPSRPNGRLLFVVANRGRVGLLPFSAAASGPEITRTIDAGDGFLLRAGWTVAWCGWQWDVVRRPGLVGLEAPFARVDPGFVTAQFQPGEPYAETLLSHWPLHPPPERMRLQHRPYPAIDDGSATLTVRDAPASERRTIARSRWGFTRDGTAIALDGGFEAGRIYEAVYRTPIAPVVGCGLLAVRDIVAHLRADVDATFAYGASQSGRFLRQFLHDGMNAGPVFDGMLPHVAGARRGEFNQRYGQPSVQHVAGPGHLPPFETGELVDRAGGRVRVVETNTSSEYWRSDCSLVHTSHPDVRQYMLAGTMHVPGLPRVDHTYPTLAGARGANPLNTVNASPLLRAALVNLERWVCDGIEPPPSAVPDPGVRREDVLRRFGGRAELPTVLPGLSDPYQCLVSDVDDDCNEVDGIRMPDLSVPLAAHTGWNPRDASMGGAGQCVDMLGSTIPFPRSRIAGLYPGGRGEYVERVRAAADELVSQRHLLARDLDAVVRNAGRAWDLFTG